MTAGQRAAGGETRTVHFRLDPALRAYLAWIGDRPLVPREYDVFSAGYRADHQDNAPTLLAALELHVGKNGHTAGCSHVSMPAYDCSPRCQTTRAAIAAARATADESEGQGEALTQCQAGKDGDCAHRLCPQRRDGEPSKSRRHCPLDTAEDDDA